MSLRRRAVAVALPAALLAAVVAVPAAPAAAAIPQGGAAVVLARMSLPQRVGQVFMVGGAATGVSSATRTAVSRYHAGNVMLTGRSYLGVTATARVTAGLRSLATTAATAGVPLFIGTDQEGGKVQVLHGSGFSTIPSALTQGTWSTSQLRAAATTWARQLRAAGVNVNLAPVLDVVPSAAAAPSNPPIGALQREYGYTPATVASHGTAFAQGMAAGGVDATAKHFPGLGRVTGNTDTTAGVTDRVTTRHDPNLAPYAAAIKAGLPFVMMSTVYYSRIDAANPAAFSPTVVTGMLRGDLGFRGVVVSDDLGNARQVAAWSPGTRAVRFLAAGGDMVLDVNPDLLPQMYGAVLARAGSDAAFRATVDAAALRILRAKQARGLIGPAHVAGDYTGDGRSDPAVFRPSTGTWWVRGRTPVQWGVRGDIPVPADYTGEGTTDIAVYRPATGTWWVRGHASVQFGVRGDIPVPGDYIGDGVADIAVYRPATGTWWIRGQPSVHFGIDGDVPAPGDYTGDGRVDVAVFRPSTGAWWVRGAATVTFGQAGDVAVPADYTGDGRADRAVFRPSTGTWYVQGQPASTVGAPGDVPVRGDFDGDGRADRAVWRPADGTWRTAGRVAATYGVAGDVPVVAPGAVAAGP